MYRFRGVRCLLGAVIAVLVGCAVPAAALPVPVPGSAGAVPGAVRVATAPVAHAVASAGQGPSCDPGSGDHGQAPGVPPRGAGEHAHAPLGRPAADQLWADRTPAVRVHVRGPDQAAPGPVELSVMRV